jgi:hypothetical protein
MHLWGKWGGNIVKKKTKTKKKKEKNGTPEI